MPTLSAMFKLMDGYSSQINKIIDRTDRAMTKMLGASKAADKVNDSLGKTGKKSREAIPGLNGYGNGLDRISQKAQKANSGLKTLIGTIASAAAIQKGMGITDTYTNAQARLGMITGSDEERNALQRDVFAAANRSRGNYADMANATAKMRLLAGDNFTSNQEALGFTELLQKSLKVSGASQTEQDSAFLQLTQAMAAGKLQGDEFRSVMENAPMVADAIAKYTGRTKGELKELSSQGLITSDIIKNALFMAADDINDKFSSMPMTFADIWGRIKNAGMEAFGDVFNRINDMLNSDMGQSALNSLTGAIYMAAEAADYLLDGMEFIGQHMDVLAPVVLGVAGAWLAYNAVSGAAWLITMKNVAATALKTTADWAEYAAIFMLIWAQEGFNAALAACPITWIIGAVILLVAAFYAGVAAVNHFAGTSVSATGAIVGAISVAGAFIGNIFIAIWNLLIGIIVDVTNACISFGEFFAIFLINPGIAIKNLFLDIANFAVGVLQSLAKVIDTIFGCNLANTVGNWADHINDIKTKTLEKGIELKRYNKEELQFDRLSYSKSFDKGYNIGKGIADKASNLFSGFKPELNTLGEGLGDGGYNYEPYGGAGNPATVKGAGKNGSVNVTLEDEDVDYLRQLAERDYVARISQNTLAPNIHVEFTGDINQTADVDVVAGRITQIMRDEIETAPEGAY